MSEDPNIITQASHAAYNAARAVVPFMVDPDHNPATAAAVRPVVEDLMSRHGIEGVCELVGQMAIGRALEHAGGLLSRRPGENGDLTNDQVIERMTAEIDAYERRIMTRAQAIRDQLGGSQSN